MIWPFLILLNCAVLAFALARRNYDVSKCMALMLCGYGLTRCTVMAFDPADFNILAALIWGGVAGLCIRYTKLREIPSLLAVVPLCYAWAEFSAAKLAAGVAPYVIADCAAILAMMAGWRRARTNSKSSDLGRGYAGRLMHYRALLSVNQAQKTPEIMIWGRNVRR